MPKQSKDKISYFYDAEVGSVYYGPNHPMKPHRLCMTHHLVMGYELHKKLEIYRPRKVSRRSFAGRSSTNNEGIVSVSLSHSLSLSQSDWNTSLRDEVELV